MAAGRGAHCTGNSGSSSGGGRIWSGVTGASVYLSRASSAKLGELPKPGRWIGAGLWPQPLKSARSIEQIGMGSSPNQDESIVPLVPDQQPVRFDVTFPAGRPVPGQPMLPMSWVERLIRQKSLHDTPELVEILVAAAVMLPPDELRAPLISSASK